MAMDVPWCTLVPLLSPIRKTKGKVLRGMYF